LVLLFLPFTGNLIFCRGLLCCYGWRARFNCGESAKSWCGVSCFRYDEDMSLDVLCGVVENVLERWCGAVEAGPFALVEGVPMV
jgi:hypothetical protein